MGKKILALVLSAALVLSMCLTPALAAPGKTYPDAVGNWAESSIKRWSNVGIVTGDNTGRVHPGQYLRRCELATILVRLLGLSDRAPDNTFTDVPAGAWYADAILKCAAAGIMEGYDGRADPEDNITREQAITMIGRALGVKSKEGQSLSKYRDADSAFAYSKGYLSAFTAMGILNGVGDGSRVAPKQSIDRASAFALLDRAIGAYVTTSGVVEVNDPNQFVVINAAVAGDVTLTGKCAGVLITHGSRATVKFSGLTADTVKVDAPVTLEVVSSSKLGTIDLNAPAALEVAANCTVGSINTDHATKNGVAPTIKDQSTTTSTSKGSTSSGGGGGGGRPITRPSASPVPSAEPSAEPSGSPAPSTAPSGSPAPSTEPSGSPEPSQSPAPSQSPDPAQPVYSIALDAETVTLKVGDSKTVTATVTPAGAEVYALSSDAAVVTAQASGNTVILTAQKVGSATVSIGVENGPGKTVSVTVTAAGEPGPGPDEPDPGPGPDEPDETVYHINVDTNIVNGAVAADKTQAKKGDTVILTVTPDQGYELEALTVDGQTVTVTNGKYTFTMPAKDVSVTATFKTATVIPPGPDEPGPDEPDETVYHINVDTNIVNGAVTADKTQAKRGDAVTLTVTPDQGYELEALTVDGTVVTATNGTYIFTMPAKDVSVTATFKAKPTQPDEPDPEPENVTVTLAVAGDAADAVESVTLQGATWANGVYTVEKDTDVTVVVTLKGDKDADAYTVSADAITFTVSGNTFQATVKATANMTITITVAKKPDAEQAKQD